MGFFGKPDLSFDLKLGVSKIMLIAAVTSLLAMCRALIMSMSEYAEPTIVRTVDNSSSVTLFPIVKIFRKSKTLTLITRVRIEVRECRIECETPAGAGLELATRVSERSEFCKTPVLRCAAVQDGRGLVLALCVCNRKWRE